MATQRQILAAQIYTKKMVENRRLGKQINMGKVMKEAGFSIHTQTHPGRVLESKGWHDIIEGYFPDWFLIEKHRTLLDKMKYFVVRRNGVKEVIKTDEIDAKAVAKGLDMAYKIKGKYNTQEIPVEEDPLEKLSLQEIDKRIIELERKHYRDKPRCPTCGRVKWN